jgi:hypothetical protein
MTASSRLATSINESIEKAKNILERDGGFPLEKQKLDLLQKRIEELGKQYGEE